jgi:hypothetical protein
MLKILVNPFVDNIILHLERQGLTFKKYKVQDITDVYKIAAESGNGNSLFDDDGENNSIVSLFSLEVDPDFQDVKTIQILELISQCNQKTLLISTTPIKKLDIKEVIIDIIPNPSSSDFLDIYQQYLSIQPGLSLSNSQLEQIFKNCNQRPELMNCLDFLVLSNNNIKELLNSFPPESIMPFKLQATDKAAWLKLATENNEIKDELIQRSCLPNLITKLNSNQKHKVINTDYTIKSGKLKSAIAYKYLLYSI